MLPPLTVPLVPSSGDGSAEPNAEVSAEIATADGEMSRDGSCAESVSVAGYSHESSGECSIIVRDPGSLDPCPGADLLPDPAELEVESQQPAAAAASALEQVRKNAARQLSSSTKASSIRREASLCMDTGMVPSGVPTAVDTASAAADGGATQDAVDSEHLQHTLAALPDGADADPGPATDNAFTAWRSISAPLQEARSLLLRAPSQGWEAAAVLHALESTPAPGAETEPVARADASAVPSGQLLQPLLLGATPGAHRGSLDRLPGEALATSPVLSAASPFHYSSPGTVDSLSLPSSRTETAAVVFRNIGEPGQRGPRRNLAQQFGSSPASETAVQAIVEREDGHPGQDNMCSVGSLIALPDAATGSLAMFASGLDQPAKEYNRAPSFGIDIVRKGSSSQSTVQEEGEKGEVGDGSSAEGEGELDVTLRAKELPVRQVLSQEGSVGGALDGETLSGSTTLRHSVVAPLDHSPLATVPSAAATSLAGTLTFASEGRPSLAPSSPQAQSSAGEPTLPLCMPPPAPAAGTSAEASARVAALDPGGGNEADDEGGSECGSIGSGDFVALRGSAAHGRSAGPSLPWRPDSTHARARSAFVGSQSFTPWFRNDPQMHKSLTLRSDADSRTLPQPDLDLGAQSLLPAAADSPPMPLFAGGSSAGGNSVGAYAAPRDQKAAPRQAQAVTAVASTDTNARPATATVSSTGFFTWDSTALTSRRASSESLSSALSVSSGMPTSPLPDCSSPLDPLTVPDVLARTIGSVFDSSSQPLGPLPAPNDSEPSAFDLTEYEADSDTEPDAPAAASVCLLDLSPPGSVAPSVTPPPAAAATSDSPPADDSVPQPESPTTATLLTIVRPATAPAPNLVSMALSRPCDSSVELAASSDHGSRSGSPPAPDLGAALISPRRSPAWSAPAPIPSMHSPLAPLPPSPPLPPATSDKGFLLLDDKFPESDQPASPLAAESSCATATQDMDFRLHPFAAATASLATSATDADSGALWLQTDPSDSSPLRQRNPNDNLTTRHSSNSGNTSTAPLPSEPSDAHGRIESVLSILEPVEPMLSRRSSSAQPSSPAWAVPTRVATGSFAVPAPPPPPPFPPPPRPTLQPIITTAPVAPASPSAPLSPSTPLDALYPGTPPAAGVSVPWSNFFFDAPPSRMSSLQSSPAFSHRAMSTHRSPSGLSITPTGSASSMRHTTTISPAANVSASTSMRSAIQAAASSSTNEPPDYDPADPPMVLWLPVYHRAQRTGLEAQKEFPIAIGDIIAQRYRVTKPLGSAAFSRAVAAVDLQEGEQVCLKVIRSNKDFFDQSLDEVRTSPPPTSTAAARWFTRGWDRFRMLTSLHPVGIATSLPATWAPHFLHKRAR